MDLNVEIAAELTRVQFFLVDEVTVSAYRVEFQSMALIVEVEPDSAGGHVYVHAYGALDASGEPEYDEHQLDLASAVEVLEALVPNDDRAVAWLRRFRAVHDLEG